MERNKRDRTYHESEIRDFRGVKSHDCAEVWKELNQVNECLGGTKRQLEMVKELRDLMIQMQKETRSEKQVVNESRTSHFKASGDIVVAAACNRGNLKLVEIFRWVMKAWLQMAPTKHCCDGRSSVIYKNQIIISGGGYSDNMEKMNLNNHEESEQ